MAILPGNSDSLSQRLERPKAALLGLLGLLIALVVIGMVYVLVLRNPTLISEKTRRNMLSIRNAVIRFDLKHQRLPVSLSELVGEGLLPERSELFVSSIRSQTLWTPPIPAKEIQFTVKFSPEEFTISEDNHTFQLEYQRGSVSAIRVD